MSFHTVFDCDTKSDLYSAILPDGYTVILYGDITRGDINPYIYLYDANSSAADNFPDVIKPTLQTGNGRYLRKQPNQVQADWDETDSSSLAFIKNKPGATSLVPTGALIMWGAASAPTGWLLCDGTAISRTTYADLFALIGTTYGMGNGSTTFNVPDMRQKFPLGKASSGTGTTLGSGGGNIDHVHTVDPPNTTTSGPSATITGISLLGITGGATDTHTHDVNIASFNSGTANPPYLTLNFIIKA